MLMLLDGRPLQYAPPDNERTLLILSIAGALTREHGIQPMLLVDHTWRPGSLPGMTEKDVFIKRTLPGRAGWQLWYDWQLPRAVRKHRPSIVMLTGGIAAGPLPAPQFIWMPLCANPKETKKNGAFYASRLGETLRRGESFFCFSEKDRLWLAARGRREGEDRFGLIRPWPSASAKRLSDDERTSIKNRFAQGREFFFAEVSGSRAEDIVYLLKAFSVFKKRQLSNLRLLLGSDPGEDIKQRLETYKYRQDVHWCEGSDLHDGRLPAAAYAALYLFGGDSPGRALLDSWAAGVPVVVTAGTRMAEMAGDAALVTPGADDPTALAGHLMSVYKDESLRGRLIERGFTRLPGFAASETIARVWAVIGRTFANIQH